MSQEIIRRKLDLLAKTVSKYIDVIIEMRLIMCFHLTGGCIIVYSISTCRLHSFFLRMIASSENALVNKHTKLMYMQSNYWRKWITLFLGPD